MSSKKSSLPSSGSVSSSVLARKKAKAESQRVKLEYMQKENALLKQKLIMEEVEATSKAVAARQRAEIDLDIGLLKQEAETAAAKTEVETLEYLERGIEIDEIRGDTVDRSEMTRKFVDNLARSQEDGSYSPDDRDLLTPSPLPNVQPTPKDGPSTRLYDYTRPVHTGSATFEPALGASENQNVQTTTVTDLTQFLLRKDLLLTRFTNFDDSPDSFSMWKATFKSITTELKVSSFEEMDLLVKWLGPNSSKFARSIRAANVNNPNQGLKCIWDRLHARYGRPEMVESALKKKLSAN